MGREIRRVPKNWQHPKRITTRYVREEGCEKVIEVFRAMYKYDYENSVKERKKDIKDWFKGYKYWQKGIYWSDDGKKTPVSKKLKEYMDYIIKERKQYKWRDDYREEEFEKYKTGLCTYADVAGEVPSLPNPDNYMPKGNWYQLFETVSEGTPLTPAFETPAELVDWLTNNKDYWGDQWTREQAEKMLEFEFAPSMVVSEGKLYNARESLLIK